MPVERTLLSSTPPDPELLLAVLREVLPDGVVQVLPSAAAQLVKADGVVLATVVLPREVEVRTESPRLLGVDEPGRRWWTDVVAPSADARVEAVLAGIASRCDGVLR